MFFDEVLQILLQCQLKEPVVRALYSTFNVNQPFTLVITDKKQLNCCMPTYLCLWVSQTLLKKNAVCKLYALSLLNINTSDYVLGSNVTSQSCISV
jgi:hypothetical protein